MTTKINVVVTGAGAIIGQGIIKSLRSSGLDILVIGVDRTITPLVSALCDLTIEKPQYPEDSDDYLQFWLNLLLEHQVDLVLPGLDIDMYFFHQNRALLQDRVLLNSPKLIELCRDKWIFSEFCSGQGLAVIPACEGDSWQQCLQQLGQPPFILKPKSGSASSGIVRLDDETDYCYWSVKTKRPFFVQKFIGSNDQEYTAAAIGLGDGSSTDSIIFRRKLGAAGNTQYAEVVTHSGIDDWIRRLSNIFKPYGPTNYQFRLDGDDVFLLEINPRFSSSTSLRTAFGYNEAELAVNYALYKTIQRSPKVRSGRGWRYNEDFTL
jgi:carbamoyl-phosphate synthase large subunit